MADFIENEEAGKVDSFPFYLATVAAVSNGKYSLIFYGQSEPTSKYYRRIYIPNTSPGVGKTVLVLKISGTYIVLGEVS